MKKTALALTALVTIPAMASAYSEIPRSRTNPAPAEDVQTVITGTAAVQNLKIPTDGSACDPNKIAENLRRLKATGVLMEAKLTTTIATGHCYGEPCNQNDMAKSLKDHCAKGEALEALVLSAENAMNRQQR